MWKTLIIARWLSAPMLRPRALTLSGAAVRTALALLVVLLLGCSRVPGPAHPAPNGERTDHRETVDTTPVEPTGIEVPPNATRYWSDAQLTEAGITIRPISLDDGQQLFGPNGPIPRPTTGDLLCRTGPHDDGCMCRLPLSCENEPEGCMTFERNVAIFRDALAQYGEERVHCEWAETGRCGEFRYFYFQGGIHHYEMRWFGPDGTLVGIRNWTDHTAYCAGSTLSQWVGQVPRCTELVRDELICGEVCGELAAPIDEVMNYTR